MKLKPWIVRWYWMMLLIIPTLSLAGASSYKATNPDEKVHALSYNDLIADIESYTSFNPAQKNKVVQAFYLHTKGNDYQQFLSQSGIQLKGAGVVNGAGSVISKLDNILARQGFSGSNGLFNKLKALSTTPTRIANYASLQSFRDEFIRLHGLNNTGVKNIDEVLDDFDFLITNRSSIPNIEKYVDEMMQGANKFKGGAFGLEILSDLPPSLQGKTLTKFEASIDEANSAKGGCRFDMQFEDGNQVKFFVETKNYAQNTSFSSNFYTQFKAYISNADVTDINQIKYFFRANSGVSKAERVQKFKNMINNGGNKEQFFNSLNPTLKNLYQIEFVSDIDDAFLTTFLNTIIEVY